MSGSSPVCPDCGTPLKGSVSEGMCVVCLLGMGASLAMTGHHQNTENEFPIEFGEYTLMAEIGHGSSGRVFSAKHRELGRQVAVKILAGGGLASRDFVQRFRNEARAAASLDHPFIVPVYEVGEHEGQSFLAMRLFEAGSLARQMAKDPRRFSDSQKAARLISTLSRAVHFAHQHGILHRDLKPGNVLLDAKDQPFVTDFGLARLTEQDSTLTRTNAVLGTPAYMAPEQAKGGLPVTTSADVYGIGAVLYEMLTGMPPFAGGTTYETVRLLLNTEVRRPSAIVPGLDRNVETICLKCLSKEPAARYASAEALAEDLDRYLRGEPILARPVSALVHFLKWVNRHRALSAASAAAVISLISGVTLLALTNAKLEKTRSSLARQTEHQRQDLIRLRVDTGNRQAEEGDGYAALASFAEAAALDGELPERLEEHAFRFSASLSLLPDLLFSWEHEAKVTDVAFNPDGTRLVTASFDRTARIFNTRDGSPVARPLPHSAIVWSAAFVDKGAKVITRTVDGDVQLWLADSGAPAAGPFRGRAAMLWEDGLEQQVAISPDGSLFAVLLPDGVQLRRIADGSPSGAPIVCGDLPNAAVFNPDGRRLAILCEKGLGRIYDLSVQPPAKLREFHGVTGWRSGQWTAEGDRLAMTNCHFGVGILTENADPAPDQFRHSSMVLGCSWTPDDSRLLTWSYDTTLRFWDPLTGQPLQAVMRHRGPAFCAMLNPQGTLLASGGFDGTAKLWNPMTGEHQGALLRHGGALHRTVWSPDGMRLATASEDGTARLWSLASAGARGDWLPAKNEPVQRVSFSPDGAHAAVLTLGRNAFIYKASTAGQEPVVLPHPHRPISAGWPDSRHLITAGADGSLREWRVPEGDLVREWRRDPLPPDMGKRIPEPDLSPDGSMMAFATNEHAPLIYDSRSGKMLHRLGDRPAYLRWSPCGRFVLTLDRGNAIIWEAASGRTVSSARLPPHSNITVAGRGAKYLACATWNYAVFVIGAADGRIVAGPMPHQADVQNMAFSDDGRTLTTVALDKSVRMWSTITGEALTPSIRLPEYATHVAVHPGGRMILPACNDGHAPLFEFPEMVRTVEEMRAKAEQLSRSTPFGGRHP
ncbi:MAG: protein kinase [Verrucomicrobiota bacterium]